MRCSFYFRFERTRKKKKKKKTEQMTKQAKLGEKKPKKYV